MAADIGALLAESRQAHTSYRMFKRDGHTADARTALELASSKRAEADDADATHADPAWAESEKTHPHDQLTAFYLDQLAR